ncbi:hypothetical protein GIB67_034108 [Kingdonia uniflora]|uniref:Uncharacterized protein n=1 Tax=Kingdonia uniflora TaxID=39325 RepID=A0A7J7M695_9MAGN|nr:hypothetical protein GIB67_034108 [Kingdonia uniflora]
MKKTEEGVIIWRKIPGLERSFVEETEGRDQWRIESRRSGFGGDGRFCSISMVKKGQIRMRKEFSPSLEQLLKHPLALFSFVPKDFTLFISGLMAEVASKTITAPLNRIKILMQWELQCRVIGAH